MTEKNLTSYLRHTYKSRNINGFRENMDRRQIFATYTTEKSCTVKICPQNSLLHKSSNTAGIWPIWGGCMAELKQWVSDLAVKTKCGPKNCKYRQHLGQTQSGVWTSRHWKKKHWILVELPNSPSSLWFFAAVMIHSPAPKPQHMASLLTVFVVNFNVEPIKVD